MEKEFVPYELALKMKALGFDEPCMLFFSKELNMSIWLGLDERSVIINKEKEDEDFLIPTFSQAFRWFREKYNLCIVIKPIDDKKLELGYNLTKNGLIMGAYTTYEKAEQACLDKLIEIIENQK